MVFGMFSTSQFISMLLAPLSLAMLAWLARINQGDPLSANRNAAA